MSVLILTHGPTHSGKTTFGTNLRKALGENSKFIHVDNDLVDEFIKANFNNLRTDPEVLARRTPSDPDLRLRIPQLIADYALREGYGVIATAAHPKQVIRQSYLDIATKNNAKAILLIFRVSDDQAAQRIEQNARDVAVLDISPHGGTNFYDLYANQKNLMEEPSEDERKKYSHVFEVNEDNSADILNKLMHSIQKE